MQELKIIIHKEKIELVLQEEAIIIDNEECKDDGNLSRDLLGKIDIFLKKNKVKKETVLLLVESKISDDFMSSRIARSVQAAWTI